MFVIAFRYIFRHRKSTVIIGMVFLITSLLMSLSTGIIAGMKSGIHENVNERFSGDINIIHHSFELDTVWIDMSGEVLEPIEEIHEMMSYLSNQEWVESFIPILKGNGMLLNERGDAYYDFLLGVDFDAYQKFVKNNVMILSGKKIQSGKPGFLISKGNRNDFFRASHYWLIPENQPFMRNDFSKRVLKDFDGQPDLKNDVVFMGIGEEGSLDIRRPVSGVISYQGMSYFWDYFDITDIRSFQEAFGFLSADETASVSDENLLLLEQEDRNFENMFEEAETLNDMDQQMSVTDLKRQIRPETDNKENISSEVLPVYNIILVKIDERKTGLKQANQMIEKYIKQQGFQLRSLTWKESLNEMVNIGAVMRGILFVSAAFIYFVGVMIVMNIFLMSLVERTSEIAMMRSVGAGKKELSRMVFFELSIVSFFFGFAGIVLGAVITNLIALMNIPVEYTWAATFFWAGDTVCPVFGMNELLINLGLLFLMSLAALIFPLKYIRNIKAVEALNSFK